MTFQEMLDRARRCLSQRVSASLFVIEKTSLRHEFEFQEALEAAGFQCQKSLVNLAICFRETKKDAYIMYIYMYEYINLLILKRCAIQNDSFNHIPELNSAPFCRYSAVGTLDGDSGDAKKSNRHAHAWRLRPSGLPRPSPLPTFKVQKLQEVLGIWLNLHNFAKFILHSFRILPLSTHLDMKLEFRSMDTFELSPSLLAGGSRNEKSSYEEKMLCVKLLTCQFAC